MKRLIFIEKRADKALTREFLGNTVENSFIALSPEASYELEKEGIKCVTPSEYLGHAGLRKMHLATEKSFNALMERLDIMVREYDDRFRRDNLAPFFHSAYQFKGFFDNLYIKTVELDRILMKETPDKVVYFRHIEQPIDDTLLANKRESVYGQILDDKDFRKRYADIDWIGLKGMEDENIFSDLWTNNVLNPLKEVAKEILLCGKGVLLWIKGYASTDNEGERKGILLVGECKNSEYVLDGLREAGFGIVRINRNRLKRIKVANKSKRYHWSKFRDHVAEDLEVHRLCAYENFDFFEPIKKRLTLFIGMLEGYYDLYEHLGDLLKKKGMRLILQETYTPNRTGNAPLIEAAAKKKIPKACWIHGGTCSAGPGWPFIDLRFADHYLVYGDKMKDFIADNYADYSMDVHVVGSPYMEEAGKWIAEKKEKKKIVFALRDYFNNDHQQGWPDPDYRDDRLWEINKRILDVLGKFQDRYDITLKLLPGLSKNELFKQYLKDKGFDNIKAIAPVRTKLYHLVPETDLFIFDWVSTGFFEASVGKGGIFIYSRSDMSEDVKKIIKSRANLYDEIDEFLRELGSSLKRGDCWTAPPDERFTSEYLNIKKRNDNINLAVNTITKVISEV
ncbi:MAG: hypothetical protein ABH869_01440 [Candidatus Omnitrophota bacterium]